MDGYYLPKGFVPTESALDMDVMLARLARHIQLEKHKAWRDGFNTAVKQLVDKE